MFVAIVTLELHLPASNSLKHKRMILNSFKGKLRNNFNVSVAEVDGHDKWQKAVVAICQVGKDRRYLDGATRKIVKFADLFNGVSVLNSETEIL